MDTKPSVNGALKAPEVRAQGSLPDLDLESLVWSHVRERLTEAKQKGWYFGTTYYYCNCGEHMEGILQCDSYGNIWHEIPLICPSCEPKLFSKAKEYWNSLQLR